MLLFVVSLAGIFYVHSLWTDALFNYSLEFIIDLQVQGTTLQRVFMKAISFAFGGEFLMFTVFMATIAQGQRSRAFYYNLVS